VPASAIVGGVEGRGFGTAMRTLDRGRLSIAASFTGVAGRILDDMVEYAVQRHQFGRRITDRDVQVHGGAGYVADDPAERHRRDARLSRIYEGTTQIQQIIIARSVIRSARRRLGIESRGRGGSV
jgi:acyl-CoA dehydrogenase